jgi:chemotaxis protein CheD
MSNSITIGLGERVISRNPDDVLVAFGLGSCLAISMVDPVAHLSGMIHAVLPEENNGSGRNNGSDSGTPGKFVDSGIQGLLTEMIKQGASTRNLVIRVAGGANMLMASTMTNSFDIGTRNIQSAHRTLDRLQLRLRNEQVGGNIGRTVRLFVNDGHMTVRTVGGKEQEL